MGHFVLLLGWIVSPALDFYRYLRCMSPGKAAFCCLNRSCACEWESSAHCSGLQVACIFYGAAVYTNDGWVLHIQIHTFLQASPRWLQHEQSRVVRSHKHSCGRDKAIGKVAWQQSWPGHHLSSPQAIRSVKSVLCFRHEEPSSAIVCGPEGPNCFLPSLCPDFLCQFSHEPLPFLQRCPYFFSSATYYFGKVVTTFPLYIS